MASKFAVLWSTDARADLAEIIEYIADESPSNARRMLRALQARAQSLGQLPERGHIVDEAIGFGLSLRELIEGPWRILYTANDERVSVMGIVDGHRDLEAFLEQRFGPQRPPDN